MCRGQAEKVTSQYSLLPIPGPTPTTNVFTFELLPNPPSFKKGGFVEMEKLMLKGFLSIKKSVFVAY